MEEAVLKNKDYIRSKIKSISDNRLDISKEDKHVLQDFYYTLFNYKLLFKLCRQPNDKLKYPKKLDPDKDTNNLQNFESSKFYWINHSRPIKKKNYFLLFLLIFSIVAFCLFPLWTLTMKLAVWWIIMCMLLLLVSRFNYINRLDLL